MIRIEEEQFDVLREQINFMVNKALRDMIETDTDVETVTAKIKITMDNRAVPVTPSETRIARIPAFVFKVTNAKQIKNEVEGEVYEDQMEIHVDESGELTYSKIKTGQMSVFDVD